MTVACVEKHASRTKPDRSTKRFDSELKTVDGSVTARLASTIVLWRITRSSSAAPLSRESPLVRPPGHPSFSPG
jgi:hypothetical protein